MVETERAKDQWKEQWSVIRYDFCQINRTA